MPEAPAASPASASAPTRNGQLGAVFALLIAMFANAFAMSNPFPYVPFLVVDFGLTDDLSGSGWYAGFILSSFMIGRAISSFHLGMLSDTHGRKLVIQLGLFSCLAFQLAFGVAPGFGWALLARFLMGLFNGIIGVAKAALPEVLPARHQPLAMSTVAGIWGLGNVVGPAVGGVLWSPGAAFPCLAANLVGAALALVGMLAVQKMLRIQRPPPALGEPAPRVAAFSSSSKGAEAIEPVDEGQAKAGGSVELSGACGGGSGHVARDESRAALFTGVSSSSGGGGGGDIGTSRAGGAASRASPAGWFRRLVSPLARVPRASLTPIGLYSMLSLNIIYDEVVTLWCAAPRADGGAGLAADEIGLVMAVCGAAMFSFNVVLFPLISRRVPPTTFFIVSTAGYGLLVPITPLFGRLLPPAPAPPSALALGAIMLHQVALRCLSASGFTSIFLIINNSTPARYRGRVNGLSMTIASVFKAAGPMLGSLSFAWSLHNGLSVPGLDVNFAFLLSALPQLAVAAMAISRLGPEYNAPCAEEDAA